MAGACSRTISTATRHSRHTSPAQQGRSLVNVEGVNAFVPLSQLVSGPDRGSPENTQNALSQWVGKTITLKVIELNRRRNRAILSERAAVQEKRAAEKERLLLELHEGDVKEGTVTSIRDFGIFVDIGGADGLVHLSELSWERTPKSPHELFKVGDEVPVFVLKIDNESKKIALSVRRAQPERWEEIVANYREGQIVPGQVTKLAPFGAFVRLEGPIEGLIHISELVDRRINHPREVVDENDVVPVKIVRIEYDRHRLGLSLRQARDKSEEDGWTFNEAGNVLAAPQDALDRWVSPRRRRAMRPVDLSRSLTKSRRVEPEAVDATASEELTVESVSEATAVEEPAADAEVPVEGLAEPEAAIQADEESEPEPETESIVEQTLETEAALEPDAEPESAAEAEPEVAAEQLAGEEPEVESEPEPEAELEADAEPEAEPEPEVEAELAAEPKAESEPEAEAEVAAEPEAESEPGGGGGARTRRDNRN